MLHGSAVTVALAEYQSPWPASGVHDTRSEMRFPTIALVLLCFGCAEGPSSPEQALISEVEKRVHMPKGAGELRCYKRYYTVVRGKQLEELLGDLEKLPFREMLIGTYREPGPEDKPGIQWVGSSRDVPKIYDGGCGDMRVWYAVGWPEKEIKASCSFDFSGNIPEEIRGKPLTC